jgi:hypothetical protein
MAGRCASRDGCGLCPHHQPANSLNYKLCCPAAGRLSGRLAQAPMVPGRLATDSGGAVVSRVTASAPDFRPKRRTPSQLVAPALWLSVYAERRAHDPGESG